MNCEIISIGDEILIGQISNTNSQFMSSELNKIGIYTDYQTTIGDNLEKIISAINLATSRADLIILTGGLGPTHDDITKNALCNFFNCELILDEPVLKNIQHLLLNRNLELTDLRKSQAFIPSKAKPLENIFGTAPGLLFEFEKENKFLIALPGVPSEMKYIFHNSVIPFLKTKSDYKTILHKTLKTTGISESNLADLIGDINFILKDTQNSSLAFLPSQFGVKLRITIRGIEENLANEYLILIENKIRTKINKYIFTSEDEEIEDVIQNLFLKNNFTLSVAESCTGGMLSNRLTNVSGSSKYFLQGFVTYSNESKINSLKIEKELIEKFGAVSSEVAIAMALNCRILSGSIHSISITGIAGPTGETTEKPIGLVFIGYSSEKENISFKFNFFDDRIKIKERATQQALEILRRKILSIE